MNKGTVFAVRRFGTAEDVSKITAEELYNAYTNALATYPIEIYVTGNCDFYEVASEFKRHFEKITRNVMPLKKAKIIRSANNSVKQLSEKQNIAQGKLAMGFRTGKSIEDGNYHIYHLFNEIFGASPTSKLFVNVREKMSLCYYCRSAISQRTGVMLVSSGIKFENKEIAEKAILEQLEAMKNGDISIEELENAKRSLKNAYMQIYDSPSAMQAWTLNREISNNNDIPLEEAAKVENTTVEQIAELAKGITLDTVYFLKGEDNNG
jgi:predicted Zn-dependent peptidase